jgi:predicted MFS family arabinose efflux permease
LCAASLSFLALILLALIREPEISDQKVPTEGANRSGVRIWSSLKAIFSQPVIRQMALVQVVFGFGVAILTPYLNLYFDEKFQVGSQTLGVIFSLKSLFTGLAAFGLPRLVWRSGSRIRIAVLAQLMGGLSRLALGFSSNLGTAAGVFLIGGVFLTTPMPLIEAFSMELVKDHQRATLVSIRELSWQFSWGVGPYLSGSLQEHFGFSLVFVFSSAALCLASGLNQVFFGKKEQLIVR